MIARPDSRADASRRPVAGSGWLSSLRRLLGGPPEAAQAEPGPEAAQPAAAAAAAPTAPSPLASDPALHFSARVLGMNSLCAKPMERAERDTIVLIEHLALNPGDSALLPRLPAVLPRLMSLVRRDDSSTRELTENLGRDPTLVGEVIRIANSPRYRTGREISDLQGAVLILGQRGLIQLLIQASMRPIFECDRGRFAQADFSLPWKLAERCSHACARLASASGVDPFHAYLAGMSAHLGWIPSLRLFTDSYRGPQPPDSAGFHAALGHAASRLSGTIARQWSFAPEVCAAADGTGTDGLALAVRTAARLSQWHLLEPERPQQDLAGLPAHERLCFLDLAQAFAQ